MNEVTVKIDPYDQVNEFTVNGRGVSPYSELNNFVKRPFLSWAWALFPALTQEINDRFAIKVTAEEFETRFLEDMAGTGGSVSVFRKGTFTMDMCWEDRTDEFAALCSRYGKKPAFRKADTDLYLSQTVPAKDVEALVSRYGGFQSLQDGFLFGSSMGEVRVRFQVPGLNSHGTPRDTVYVAGSMDEARAVCTDRLFDSGESMVLVLSDQPGVIWQNHCYYWGVKRNQLCHVLELLYVSRYMIPWLREEIGRQALDREAMDPDDARTYAMLSQTDALLAAEELPVLEKGQSCRIRVNTIPSGQPLPEIQVKIDQPLVAVSKGLTIEALSRGTTEIHLFSVGSGIPFASLTLTVEEHNYASSLKIQAKDRVLGEGHELGLAVEAVPKDAEDLKTCRWISSDPRVAFVDSGGLVRGISGGTAQITVKGVHAEDTVTVQVRPRIRKITIGTRNMELFVGDRQMTSVDTQPKDCYDGSWNWTSTDSHVAVMSLDRGYPEIVAKGIGNCIITVRANDGTLLDNCTVTVASTFYRKENRHTDLSISLVLTLLAFVAGAVWLPAGAAAAAASVIFAVRAIKNNKKDLGYAVLFIILSLTVCLRTALWVWTDVMNHIN